MTYHDPRDGDPLYIVGPDYLDRKPGMFRSWTPPLVAVLIVVIAALFATQVAASRSAQEPTVRVSPAPALTGALRPVTSTAAEDNSASFHIADLLGIRGTATWCAPTPKYCQSWGGSAHKGAVASFRWGDKPYPVQVCRAGTNDCTVVTVVSYCACGSTLIDLSPAAFRELAPLGRGRIVVEVERLVHLPPTDTER